MKRILSILSLTILIIISSNSFGYAQATGVIGKLFTKAQADQNFGKVNSSVTVNTLTITQAIEKSPDYLLFNIVNGNLLILNRKRGVLYSANPATMKVASNVPFHIFSVSKVKELISSGGNNPFTIVELRDNGILTITNGTETMEMSLMCPPYCP